MHGPGRQAAVAFLFRRFLSVVFMRLRLSPGFAGRPGPEAWTMARKELSTEKVSRGERGVRAIGTGRDPGGPGNANDAIQAQGTGFYTEGGVIHEPPSGV